MAANRGKQFEAKFKSDWLVSFPGSFCYRLPDQQSGYFGTSKNPCDFLCFANGTLFILELKTIKSNTFPLANFKQYDEMRSLTVDPKYPNVIKGIIIWYYERDKVMFVPLDTYAKMLDAGEKSVNVRFLLDKYKELDYNIIEIPSKKKRVFMDSDYTVLLEE